MKIYDVSLTMEKGMLAFPGDPDFLRRPFKSLRQGDGSNLSLLTMGSHAGTHVDAPLHMLNGKPGVEAISPELLVGKCLVCEIKTKKAIEVEHLRRIKLPGNSRVLFKTINSGFISQKRFRKSFVALTEAAARYLVALGVRLVGIDYLSVDKFKSHNHPAHRVFLKAGVVIIEGLNLKSVLPGEYELFCGPLKIKESDGAPARVFLKA